MIAAHALYRTFVCLLVSCCAYIALSGCSNDDVKPECKESNHAGSWLSSVPDASDPACITTSPEKAENFALYLLSFIFGHYLERTAFRHALSALSVYLYLLQCSSPYAGRQESSVAGYYYLHLEALHVLASLMWALHPLVAVQAVCGGWLGLNPYAWYGILSLYFVGTYKAGTLLHAYNALSAAYYLYYAAAADVADAVAWPTAVSTWQALSAVPSLPSSYWTSLARSWTARVIHSPASALVPYGWEGQERREGQAGSADVVHMLRVLAVASACALALSQALIWLTSHTGSPAQRLVGPLQSTASSARGRAVPAASSSSSSSVSEAPSNPHTAVHTSPPSSLAGYLPSPPATSHIKGASPARALARAVVPGSASSMASYASGAARGGRRRAGSSATTGKASSRAPSHSSSTASGGGSDSADIVPVTPLSKSTLHSSGGAETHPPDAAAPPMHDGGHLVRMYHTGLLYTLACLLLHDAAHAMHAAAAWSAGGALAVPHPTFAPSDLYLPLACGAILCLSALLQALQGAVYRLGGSAAAALYVALAAAGLLWIITRRSVPLIGVWSDPVLLWDALVHTQEMGTHPAAHLAYAHALAAAAAVAGNASMLALAMAHYESARSLSLDLSSAANHGYARVHVQANLGLSELTLGTFVNATAALTAWEAGSMASQEGEGGGEHEEPPGRGGAAATSVVLQAGYTEAWEAAVHAHKAVVHAVAWHAAGSGHALSPEEIVVKEVMCSTVGRAALPRMQLQGSVSILLQHAQGYANAGNLMALAAARSRGQVGQRVSGEEAVEAWKRAATLLALHVVVLPPPSMGKGGQDKRNTIDRRMPAPGSTLSASDLALSLGDNLHSGPVGGAHSQHMAGRVYELGLQAAATAASAPALAMLQAVTKAIVVRQHGSRSGGRPLSLPFVYVPTQGDLGRGDRGQGSSGGTEESVEAHELVAAHTAAFQDSGVVQAIRWADPSHPLLPNTTTLASLIAERPVPAPVCVEHRVTGIKAIRTTAPAPWVTYERAVAELRALLVSSAPHSTGGGQDEAWFARMLLEAPVCVTAHEWESECGKMLILANRAATVAAEAARLASRGGASSTSPLCTCASVPARGDGGPGSARTVRLCAQQDTSLLQDEPPTEHAHTASSVLGLLSSSPQPSCGRVDGLPSATLPAALAGWMHCAVEDGGLPTLTAASCTATQQELSFARALASLLPLYAPSSRPGSVSMARALVLSARAHALTLLALRYQLPGAPRPPITLEAALGQALPAVTNSSTPAGRALVQALHASRAGLAMLTEACGCE